MIVGVIGLGTMGAGIVQVAAQNDCQVIAFDAQANMAQKCATNLEATLSKLLEKEKISKEKKAKILNNISYTSQLSGLANCDLIIEAIVENISIKKKVFEELETYISKECILATNTSSLSVTSIAAACTNAERFIGIHFFNPAPLMALVEIIPAVQTNAATILKAKEIIDAWGKATVLAKDTPGFIVNRIARPFYNEAIRMYEEAFATKEQIDFSVKQKGFKMGPFELMDMIGHDVNYIVTETVWREMFYDDRYKPSFTQKRLLEAGWLGKKSGKGFYNYEAAAQANETTSVPPEMAEQIANRILLMLFNEAAEAARLQIASPQDIETAMTKGVNYPKGLLAWANEYGHQQVRQGLDKLYSYYGEDRYRCSPYFKEKFIL